MNDRTHIKNASWVCAWDAEHDEHVYRRDADVVFEGDAITFVGHGYTGEAGEVLDGRGRFILPGLIDVHSHPSTEPAHKGIREEHAVPAMYMSGLYQRVVNFRLDDEGKRAAVEVAYAELLASGVTTLADLSFPFDGWMEVAARSGMRIYLGPGYASAGWKLGTDHRLEFDWDEPRGIRGFERALELIERARAHPCGTLEGILYPAQIETCTEALFRESMAAGEERDLPVTTHLSQSVPEFHEMIARHGKTPVQWANDIGILGPRMTLGHAIFVDEHSWVRWHTRADVRILAETATNVAHCPTPFSRYGQTLEDFGRYRRAGVRLAMGTDCNPHNLLEEMRTALILARIAARDAHTVHTADLLHAATVGGARALGRDDLGRIAPGCRADLVVVDLTDETMRPARDPLRSLVYTAAERAVRDVYVAGKKVVADGVVTTLDRGAALSQLERAQQQMMSKVPEHDHAGRGAEDLSPLSLRVMP